jgi:hypothetical protein
MSREPGVMQFLSLDAGNSMQLFCWDYNQSRPAFKDEIEALCRLYLAARFDTARNYQ